MSLVAEQSSLVSKPRQKGMDHYCYHVSPAGCRVHLSIVSRPGPVLISFHGGGIVYGSRLGNFTHDEGFDTWPGTVVEADYRLLVPSTGYDIRDDVQALLLFLSGNDSPLSDVETQRYRFMVMGHSGGGYPMRLAAVLAGEESLRPSPRFRITGLVSYFGMGGDLLHDYWLFSHRSGCATLHAQSAEAQGERYSFSSTEVAELDKKLTGWRQTAECSATDDVSGPFLEGHNRSEIWDAVHAGGCLNDAITGEKGLSLELAAIPRERRAEAVSTRFFDVYPQLYFAKHSERIAPLLLIHGDNDDLVPIAESEHCYDQLASGGRVEIKVLRGGNHHLMVDQDAEPRKEIYEYTLGWMRTRAGL